MTEHLEKKSLNMDFAPENIYQLNIKSLLIELCSFKKKYQHYYFRFNTRAGKFNK